MRVGKAFEESALGGKMADFKKRRKEEEEVEEVDSAPTGGGSKESMAERFRQATPTRESTWKSPSLTESLVEAFGDPPRPITPESKLVEDTKGGLQPYRGISEMPREKLGAAMGGALSGGVPKKKPVEWKTVESEEDYKNQIGKELYLKMSGIWDRDSGPQVSRIVGDDQTRADSEESDSKMLDYYGWIRLGDQVFARREGREGDNIRLWNPSTREFATIPYKDMRDYEVVVSTPESNPQADDEKAVSEYLDRSAPPAEPGGSYLLPNSTDRLLTMQRLRDKWIADRRAEANEEED